MQRDLTLASPCEQTIATLISTLALHGIQQEGSADLRSTLPFNPLGPVCIVAARPAPART